MRMRNLFLFACCLAAVRGFAPKPLILQNRIGSALRMGGRVAPRCHETIMGMSMDRRGVVLQLPLAVLAGVSFAKAPAAQAADGFITVIGANGGNLGSELVASLVRKNLPVRTVFRSDRVLPKEINPDGLAQIEAVVADVMVTSSLEKAVAGSKVVIFAASSRRKSTTIADGIESDLGSIVGDTPETVDHVGLENVARECIKNRVPRLIVISQAACTKLNDARQEEICNGKIAGEEAVREMYRKANLPGVSYTIARAGKLVQGMRRGAAEIELNQGDSLSGFISRADMADLVAEIAISGSGEGSTFEAFYTDTANPTNFKKSLEECLDTGKSVKECMFGSEYKNLPLPNMNDVLEGRVNAPILPAMGVKTGKERTGSSWSALTTGLSRDSPSKAEPTKGLDTDIFGVQSG